jgi:hypothetical protein
MIQPGEHRVYLPVGDGEWAGTLSAGMLVQVVRHVVGKTYRLYRCRGTHGETGQVWGDELHDPNDARGYPPLEEDGDADAPSLS